MRETILFMFRLIAAAVGESELPKAPENVSWETIYKASKVHNVANIIGYAVTKGGYDVPQEIRQQFTVKMYERVSVSENQNREAAAVIDAFCKNGIYHMPFKGLVLQKLYPAPDMRFMADADILIKEEQFEKINEIMMELGYTFEVEGPIEYNYVKKPYMHFELHKALIAKSSEDQYEYYKNCWNFAKKTDKEYHYAMSLEDEFIFTFNHFVRHYRDAGVGIKGVIDMWIFMKKCPQLDMDYTYSELEKINMTAFFNNIVRLTKVWFEGEEMDEVTSHMTGFILNSGTFGTLKNQMSAKSIRDNENIENAEHFKYLKFIFPKASQMKNVFPVLQKLPFLLPVFYVWRVIRFVLFRRKDIEKHKKTIQNIDTQSIKKYDEHMKIVGLDMKNGRTKR